VNLCRACGLDFGSVSAFDAHRVGKPAYMFAEGLDFSPPREDGRRCLDEFELRERGWTRDKFVRWRAPVRDGGRSPSVRSAQTRRRVGWAKTTKALSKSKAA
jgi:hypothetical protein